MIRGMTKNVNNLTDATFENMEYISVTGCYGDLHGKRLAGKFPGQENYGEIYGSFKGLIGCPSKFSKSFKKLFVSTITKYIV